MMRSTMWLSRLNRGPLPQLRRQALPGRAYASSAPLRAREVKIVEVGPRDGLQNEKQTIPLDTKVELIRRLSKTGLDTIEAGSFVHPKWVPQMANSSDILEQLLGSSNPRMTPMTYQWLLPNAKGLENFFQTFDAAPRPPPRATDTGPALNTSSADANAMPSSASGADAMAANQGARRDKHEISIFMAATETFSRKNTNCSIAESLERFKPLMATARRRGFDVRAYISVALGCPYEGPNVSAHRVAELAAALLEAGADEVSVADTTGMGTAPRTAELLKTLSAAGIRADDVALHLHDTFGQALVNTLVALEHGVTTFDSAVAGLGGCPFSPGATGNVATEDLVHMLHSLGAQTGVNLQRVAAVGDWISRELGRANESRAGKATLARLRAADDAPAAAA